MMIILKTILPKKINFVVHIMFILHIKPQKDTIILSILWWQKLKILK